MDPLSITASIVTLIDAAQKIISICKNYRAAVKGAEWELPRIIAEVESLHAVLQALEKLSKKAESQDPVALTWLQQFNHLFDSKTGSLALCLSELQTLERKLTPPQRGEENEFKRRKVIQALSWPLKKDYVEKTLQNLERFKSTLDLALGTCTLEGLSAVHETADATHETMVRVEKNTIDLNTSLCSMKTNAHMDQILHWLSVLDPSVKYNKALEDRNDKTGKWLMEHQVFYDWKQTPSSFLWLYGIPGCGKTILSSTVIEHLLDRCTSDKTIMVAYFYIDFYENETQVPENMVRSLLKQFGHQSGANQELESLYSSCANGMQQPTLDQLLSTSFRMLQNTRDRDTFFVIDALDECKERGRLLRLLQRIHKQNYPKLHVLATSRQEPEIEKFLMEMTNEEARMCIQSELVQEDIITYIRDRLETDISLKRFKIHHKIQEEIKEVLAKNAGGMFRWVACQLDSFRNCLTPISLRKALKSLLKTLNQTYERILCGIDEEFSNYARKILYWLTYSARDLRLVDIAEVVAIDATEEPRFNPENRFFDSAEILRVCSSLVSVYRQRSSDLPRDAFGRRYAVPFIRLAHFSVKEYLTSVDIWSSPAKMYAISSEIANASIAESCLAMLLYFDKPDSLMNLVDEGFASDASSDASSEEPASLKSLDMKFEKRFPLAHYAARYWTHHFHKASCQSFFLEELASKLFFDRDTLENWIRIGNPDAYLMRDSMDLSRSSFLIAHSIYYASEAGCSKQVQQLIEKGADVNLSGGSHGNALQVASFRGYQDIVELLLKRGADINITGGDFGSALQAASSEGYQDIVELLLERGANINTKCGLYESALQAASLGGYLDIVELLLKAGADVNDQGGEYKSALQIASSQGYQDIVELLLKAGADVNAQGGACGSALRAAKRHGKEAIMQILRDHGAREDAEDVVCNGFPKTILYSRRSKVS